MNVGSATKKYLSMDKTALSKEILRQQAKIEKANETIELLRRLQQSANTMTERRECNDG